MSGIPEQIVDEAKIKKTVLSGIPLTISTFTIPREIEIYLEQVIAIILEAAGSEKLSNYILYCVLELMGNAKKANAKRIYFTEKGLDINNSSDYTTGMLTFKKELQENQEYYNRLQKEKGLYIRLSLQLKNNIVYIEVRNNTPASKAEFIRIQDKLTHSRLFNNLEDAMLHELDNSEGAGLGLVIMALMFKKIGLSSDTLKISVTETETIANICIPLDNISIENLSAETQNLQFPNK